MEHGHVAFSCFQAETQDDIWYGARIDLARAMNEDADVILALEVGSYTHLYCRAFTNTVLPCPAQWLATCRAIMGRQCAWLFRKSLVRDQSNGSFASQSSMKSPRTSIKEETTRSFPNTCRQCSRLTSTGTPCRRYRTCPSTRSLFHLGPGIQSCAPKMGRYGHRLCCTRWVGWSGHEG